MVTFGTVTQHQGRSPRPSSTRPSHIRPLPERRSPPRSLRWVRSTPRSRGCPRTCRASKAPAETGRWTARRLCRIRTGRRRARRRSSTRPGRAARVRIRSSRTGSISSAEALRRFLPCPCAINSSSASRILHSSYRALGIWDIQMHSVSPMALPLSSLDRIYSVPHPHSLNVSCRVYSSESCFCIPPYFTT